MPSLSQRVAWGFIALYTLAFISTSLLFLVPLLVTLALKVNSLVGIERAPVSQLLFNAVLAALVAVFPDQVPAGQRGLVSGVLGICVPIASVSGTFLVQLFTGNRLAMFLAPCAIGGSFILLFAVRRKDRRLAKADRPTWSRPSSTPRLRRSLVARPRLSARLSRGAEWRLTLISAPAGFGKTTLLAEWLAATGTERSVAWLSLEESDSQPASYWTYLIPALQTVVPGVAPVRCRSSSRANHRSRPSSPGCSTSSAPRVHLVVSTREDPALPLARLRARGELVEVRAADLRFTLDEVAALLLGAWAVGALAVGIIALHRRDP